LVYQKSHENIHDYITKKRKEKGLSRVLIEKWKINDYKSEELEKNKK
jgi:hypothetical protein